jgi:hypothetical protein
MTTFEKWAACWKKGFMDYQLGADVEGYYAFFDPNRGGEKNCSEFHKWAKGQELFGVRPEFVFISMKELQLIKESLFAVSCH